MSFQIRPIKEFLVRPALPAPLRRLPELGLNVMWSWNHPIRSVFRRLDPAIWKASGFNPVVLLGRVSQEQLERAATDPRYPGAVPPGLRSARRLSGRVRSAQPALDARSTPMLVAYFSMEYGLIDCLPIYSGGLGVLSGDHLQGVQRRAAAAGGRGAAVSEGLPPAIARSRRLAAGTHAGERFPLPAGHAC